MGREDKGNVLVTGASSGIGEALAREFAENGYNVILVARSADKLSSLAESLEAEHGVTATVLPQDLSVAGAAGSLKAELEEREIDVDILVNNAGVFDQGAFVEISPEANQSTIKLNVLGMTDMLSHFLPAMVERGAGKVLNVSSISAFAPIPGVATYAATKAYVLSLSEALVEELRGTGVTVTALCPGFTKTPMMDAELEKHGELGRFSSLAIGEVEDVVKEGYRGLMKGTPLVVPGTMNLATTLTVRAWPKWMVRRVLGYAGRFSIRN